MPSAVEEESLRRRIHDDELTTTSVVEADHTVEEERISTVERVELGDISHHDKKNLVQQSYQGVQGVSASVYDETTTKNQDRTQQAGLEVNDTEGDNTDEDNAGQLFMDIRNRAAAADLTDGQEQVTTIHGFYHFEFLQSRLTSHPGIRCLAVSELHINLAHPEHRSPSSRKPGGHTDPRSASADRG